MLQFEPGTDAVVVVPFLNRGEPFIPTSGSVRLTLRDHDGSIVSGFNAIVPSPAPGPADTQVVITIPAINNAIAVASPVRRFEVRRVIIMAMSPLGAFRAEVPYRLVPFLNHSVTPDMVRAYVGVENDELPDSDIDVFAAFLEVEEITTAAVMTTALLNGGLNQVGIEKAILAKAVLNSLVALQQRLLLQHTDGSIAATRQKFDLKAIRGQAQSDLQSGLDRVTGRAPVSSPFFVVGTVTDVITGV